MKLDINRIERELEKLGYTIEGQKNYMNVERQVEGMGDDLFWEAIELLQGYDDNQVMENFAEYLHDMRLVVKNE